MTKTLGQVRSFQTNYARQTPREALAKIAAALNDSADRHYTHIREFWAGKGAQNAGGLMNVQSCASERPDGSRATVATIRAELLPRDQVEDGRITRIVTSHEWVVPGETVDPAIARAIPGAICNGEG